MITSLETVLVALLLAVIDLPACKSGSEQSLDSLLRDGDKSQLREVPPSAERGPPPGSQFVPIPTVPLPSGAMRRPHPSRRPSDPPPPPPPSSSTAPPLPPETLVITEGIDLLHSPRTRPKRPRPTSFTTSTEGSGVNVPLIHSEDYRNIDGSYTFEFEAANSIVQRETGYTRRSNGKDILVKKGFYRFVSPEGLLFRVDYQADEKGFRATGKHLPTSMTSTNKR